MDIVSRALKRKIDVLRILGRNNGAMSAADIINAAKQEEPDAEAEARQELRTLLERGKVRLGKDLHFVVS